MKTDTDRFAILVAPYLPDALAFARWITRDRADAEDVVQEASIRAFRALNRFSGPNARAWLLTIVRNTAFTFLRAKKAASFVNFDDLSERDRLTVERGSEPFFDGESAVITATELTRLEEEIAALPHEFREVLVLRDMQGFDYREIAHITGVPIGTVMSRLARARQKLIAQMKSKE